MQKVSFLTIFLVLILCALAGQGCESSTPTNSNSNSNTDATISPVQSRAFTGRDSLISLPGGVAFIAKVSGELQETEHPECASPGLFLSGTGRGHVTHLGETVIEQTACIEEGGNLWGSFIYDGRTGSQITGSYNGMLDGEELVADVTVETAATVQALQETPPEGQDWGGGKLEGTLSASHFDYELVGWLFHHNTEE